MTVFNAETERLMAPLLAAKTPAPSGHFVLTTTEGLARAAPIATRIAMVPAPAFDPVHVYVGPSPGYGGLVAQARPPHSPVGTSQSPASVTAYTPETPEPALAGTLLSPDAAALPMKGKVKQRRPKRSEKPFTGIAWRASKVMMRRNRAKRSKSPRKQRTANLLGEESSGRQIMRQSPFEHRGKA